MCALHQGIHLCVKRLAARSLRALFFDVSLPVRQSFELSALLFIREIGLVGVRFDTFDY